MSRRTIACAAAGALLVVCGAVAAARDGRVSEVHPLGMIDPAAVLDVIAGTLSPEGQAVPEEGRHSLLVVDYPERQALIRDLIAGLQRAAPLVRVEARLVDRESGREAAWGATGQILLPLVSGEGALANRIGVRPGATADPRQSVVVVAGGRATIRIGRQIPFAGWILRYGQQRGYLEDVAEWREVESALEVEASAASHDGAVHLALTPAFVSLQGKTRRSVAYPDLRCEAVLAAGDEGRLKVAPGQEEFYRHLLAGYDALRRVRPVDLVLRASLVRAGEAPAGSTKY